MFFLLTLFLEEGKGKEITLNRYIPSAIVSFLSLVFLYMGISLSFSYFGLNEESHKMYPYNTQNQIELLIDTESEEIADDILYRNEYVNLAHSVKARSFYKKGNFEDLIKRKNRMFSMFPFQYSEYQEYCYMLINGRELYLKMGDIESAEICAEELKATRLKVETIESKLSSLGKKIYDQPKNTLPDDINEYIDGIK
jgi:tetratricopeptide (TPR) repeat protein